jgi:hypothetical protein
MLHSGTALSRETESYLAGAHCCDRPEIQRLWEGDLRVAELQQVHKYPLAPKHDHSAPDVLIDFAETTHKLVDNAHSAAEYIIKGAKFYYGHQAFRKYDWLRGAAVLNKAKPKPNLRGMVLNKRARTLFELTVEKGEKLDKFGDVLILAGWAIELAKSKDYLEKVWQSNESTNAKWQKTSAEISMATVRADPQSC